MSAVEMMMKSFGIDPEAIKKQVEKAGDDFKAVVTAFESRFDHLKADFERVEKKIDALLEGKPAATVASETKTKTEGENK